jgi:hypothetical protein
LSGLLDAGQPGDSLQRVAQHIDACLGVRQGLVFEELQRLEPDSAGQRVRGVRVAMKKMLELVSSTQERFKDSVGRQGRGEREVSAGIPSRGIGSRG